MDIKTVGVLGAGTMGLGIVQVFLQGGYDVHVVDTFPAAARSVIARMEKTWDRAIKKGTATDEQKKLWLGHLSVNEELSALADCDLVVEAVPEKMELKRELFAQMDALCPADTILASNTSALSITEISAATKRPNKVLGTHFFNPVPAMKLAEVIPTTDTSEETIAALRETLSSIGKLSICVKESPGFVVNRILAPYMNEAFFVYQEGLASVEEIDQAMKLGAGMPMGPLELADVVGLDVCLMVSQCLYQEFGDSKYRTAPCLRQMVRAGRLGVKTKKGFMITHANRP